MAVFLGLFSLLLLVFLSFFPVANSLQLTVLHYNDLQSRFQEIDADGLSCSAEESEKQECYGGFSRLKGKVAELQHRYPNTTLLLNAGDFSQDTLWFTIYRFRLVTHFLNQLDHTAVTIGSHEFDDGVAPFINFLDNFKDPVISCNINDTAEPEMQNKYKKFIVVNAGGEKVGIIGYISEATKTLASPGMLGFNNVLETVGKEAKLLHEQGAKIIVGLGYNGLDEDRKLCRESPYIDIIVGGRTQAFLYSGTPPDTDAPVGPYPIVEKKPDGRPCLVVTAAAYGKYLGFLQVDFDSEGNPVKWSGNPILLDNTVSEDLEVHQDLEEWAVNSTKLLSEKVGETKVFLNGRFIICRLYECNMGNVLADSLVFMSLQFANDFQWNYASLAIMNSGGIRGSIEEKNINGTITLGDVYTVLPFRNKIDIVEIKGKFIREAFEHSVAKYDASDPYPVGTFLQVSGFKIKYDFCQPEGSRVVKIQTLCNECRIPAYFDFDDNSYYQLVLPRFLANGGDGFDMIRSNKLSTHALGFVDLDILRAYMQERGPIITGLEQRITIIPKTACEQSFSTKLRPEFGLHTIVLFAVFKSINDFFYFRDTEMKMM